MHTRERALLAATLLAAATSAAARPPKHLPQPEPHAERNDVAAIRLARLDAAGVQVPVVAVAERTGIRVAWYQASAGRWRNVLLREHSSLDAPAESPTRLDRTPDRVRTWSWSESHGIAALGSHVFVAYKRNVPGSSGLHVERLTWNGGTEELVPDASGPRKVPVSAPGFHVWAGTIAGRLVLVTQAAASASGPRRLLALSAQSPGSADLSLTASWTSVDLGAGGWDFDAASAGDKLLVAFRSVPLAAHVRYQPGRRGRQTLPIGAAAYDGGLTIAALDVATGAREADRSAPACEHPQLQSVAPLSLTCDRVSDGSLLVDGADSRSGCIACHLGPRREDGAIAREERPLLQLAAVRGAAPARAARQAASQPCAECHGTMTVTPDLYKVTKLILRESQTGWIEDALYSTDARLAPRSAAEPQGSWSGGFQYLVDEDAPNLRFGMLRRWDPLFLVGTAPPVAGKGVTIVALHHRSAYGILALTRFELTANGGQAREVGVAAVDVNHGHVPPGEPRPPENEQFSPFTRDEITDVARPLRLVVNPVSLALDGTIGGALTRDPGVPGLGYYAYTDDGDGGARVVFEESSVPLPQDAEAGKWFPPAAVTGPGGTSVQWYDLPPTPTPREAHLPAVNAAMGGDVALGSARDAEIDLMCGVIALGYGPGPCLVTEERAAGTLEPLSLEAGWDDSAYYAGTVGVRFEPANAYADTLVTFEGRPTSPDAAYRWTVDGELVATTSYCKRTFTPAADPDLAHTYAIGFEVVGLGTVTKVVEIQPTIWEQLWAAHGPVEVGEGVAKAFVFDVDLRFSKYLVHFRYGDGEGAARPRKEILFETLPEYDFLYRFDRQFSGQGTIEHRLRLGFETKDVQTAGKLGDFYAVDGVKGSASFVRSYTPGILTRERRSAWAADLVPDSAAALAMKPMGPGRLVVDEVEADGGLTLSGHLLLLAADVVIVVLLAFGLTAIVHGLRAALVALAASIAAGWIGYAAALAAVMVILEITVPPAIEGAIEDEVRAGLLAREAELALIAEDSGEALAEVLAVEGRRAVEGAEPPATGTNRKQPDLWEIVFVEDGKARVLVRGAPH